MSLTMVMRQQTSPKFRIRPCIRPIEQRDIFAITKIYALYVETSYATFETTPPDAKEMGERIKKLNENNYPALVAVASAGEGGGEQKNAAQAPADDVMGYADVMGYPEVMGYAYAAPYKARNAYRYTIEDSVYVKKCYLKRGIGKALLEALIAEAAKRGFWQMIAIIGKREGEGSIRLHEALGFRVVGTAVGIGFKFEQLVDVVYMQKKLDNTIDDSSRKAEESI